MWKVVCLLSATIILLFGFSIVLSRQRYERKENVHSFQLQIPVTLIVPKSRLHFRFHGHLRFKRSRTLADNIAGAVGLTGMRYGIRIYNILRRYFPGLTSEREIEVEELRKAIGLLQRNSSELQERFVDLRMNQTEAEERLKTELEETRRRHKEEIMRLFPEMTLDDEPRFVLLDPECVVAQTIDENCEKFEVIFDLNT